MKRAFVFLLVIAFFGLAVIQVSYADRQPTEKLYEQVREEMLLDERAASFNAAVKSMTEEANFLETMEEFANIKVLQKGLKKFERIQTWIYYILGALVLPLYMFISIQRIGEGSENWKTFVRNIIGLTALMFFWDDICFIFVSFFDVTGSIMSEIMGTDKVLETILGWRKGVGKINMFALTDPWQLIMKILTSILIIYAYGMKLLLSMSRVVSIGIYYILFRPVLILSLFPVAGLQGNLKRLWQGFVMVAMWPLYFAAVDALFVILVQETPVLGVQHGLIKMVFCLLYGSTLSGVTLFTGQFITSEGSKEVVRGFKGALALGAMMITRMPLMVAGNLAQPLATGGKNMLFSAKSCARDKGGR